MLALSPLFSSTGGWPFEDPVTYNHEGHQMIVNVDHNSSSCYNFNGDGGGGGGGGGSLLEAASTDYYVNVMEDYAAVDCFAYNSSHDHDIGLLHHDPYSYEQPPPPPPCNQHVDDNDYNPPLLPPPPAAATLHAHHEVDYNNSYTNTTTNNGGDRDHDGDDQYSPIPSTSIINVGVNHVVKKLNHNASERDRRKKINSLYSSLRDLLPPSDHTKKLSIPATVSRVLKYIPELQQEVETLLKKKEELSPRTNQPEDSLNQPENPRGRKESAAHDQEAPPLSSVSASQLGENEIGVQISTLKYSDRGSVDVSEVLMQLENDGLNVVNVSSFESFGGRIFYNIHLWVEGANAIKCGLISEKILRLYRN